MGSAILGCQGLFWITSRNWPDAVAEPIAPPVRKLVREELADGQLVTLALNGDKRAFPVLMARYEGVLSGLVLRRVRSPEDAADLVQDTLLSAWSALQTYPAQRPFQVWLVHIALNKCRDWGRKRSVRRRAACYLPELSPQAEADAEAALIEIQAHRAFRAALRDLPDIVREPLMLTTLGGVSQKALAAEMGVSVKTIETRVRRAKHRLLAAMNADQPDRENVHA